MIKKRKDGKERSDRENFPKMCPFEEKCAAWIIRQYRGAKYWHSRFCAGSFLKCVHHPDRIKERRIKKTDLKK